MTNCSGNIPPYSRCTCTRQVEPTTDPFAPCQGCIFCTRTLVREIRVQTLANGQEVHQCTNCNGLRGMQNCSAMGCLHFVCQDNTLNGKAYCGCHSPFSGKDAATPLRCTSTNNKDFMFRALQELKIPTDDDMKENFPWFGQRERNTLLSRLKQAIDSKLNQSGTSNYKCGANDCPRTLHLKPGKRMRKLEKRASKGKVWYCRDCAFQKTPFPEHKGSTDVPVPKRKGSTDVDTKASVEFGRALYSGEKNLLPTKWYYMSPRRRKKLDSEKIVLQFFENAAESLKLLKEEGKTDAWKLRPHLRKYFNAVVPFLKYYRHPEGFQEQRFLETLCIIGALPRAN